MEIKEGEISLKVIRSTPRGDQIAVLETPWKYLEKVRKNSKMRIGMVMARIVPIPEAIRCFKCHGIGHTATTCKEKMEEKEICMRCGGEDHTIHNCKGRPDCRNCRNEGIPMEERDHVAGSIRCPRYRAWMRRRNEESDS